MFAMPVALRPLAVMASAAVMFMSAPAAHAAVNLQTTASVTNSSSFFNFSQYGIVVVPNGQAIAQNNLLTGAPIPYTTNFETRYIFGQDDQTPSVTIKLANASSNLNRFGATWFSPLYADRAPSSVTFAVSGDGLAFTDVGSFNFDGSAGGANLLSLTNGVSGQYVRYTFNTPGQVGPLSAVAISSVSVGAVPEPATWAMMLMGFGMVGFGLRRRSNVKTTVSYA